MSDLVEKEERQVVFFSLGLGPKEKARLIIHEGKPIAVEVAGFQFHFYEVGLPDWDLLFIEPIKYREAVIRELVKFGFKVYKATKARVYFSLS